MFSLKAFAKLLNTKNKESDPDSFHFKDPEKISDTLNIKKVITLTLSKLEKLSTVSLEALREQPQSAPYLPSISRDLIKVLKELLEDGNASSSSASSSFGNYNASSSSTNSSSNSLPAILDFKLSENEYLINCQSSKNYKEKFEKKNKLQNVLSESEKLLLKRKDVSKCYFLSVVIRNLFNHTISSINKCESIESKDFTERGNRRLKEFNGASLTMQFILHELNTFNELRKRDHNANYKVTKCDANTFWTNNFGPEAIIVSMRVFFAAFEKKFNKIENLTDKEDLQEHIDITKSDFVSIYTFDTFVRLFSPWRSARKVWEKLAKDHPAFKSYMTYDEAHYRLSNAKNPPKSYIYRMSTTRTGQWAIAYKTDKAVLQTIPQSQNLADALIQGIGDDMYLYPDGQFVPKNKLKDFRNELIELAKEDIEEVEVPDGMDDTYRPIGTTFEVCKICHLGRLGHLANKK